VFDTTADFHRHVTYYIINNISGSYQEKAAVLLTTDVMDVVDGGVYGGKKLAGGNILEHGSSLT
jgi:hypothetical protein